MKIAEFLTVNLTSLKSMAISHQLQEDSLHIFLNLTCTFKFWKLYICYNHSVFLNCKHINCVSVCYVCFTIEFKYVHNMIDMLSHAVKSF